MSPAKDDERPARPVTLGEAVSSVRWDYDPGQRLLSPLVETARFFEHFPWDGDAETDAPPPPDEPPTR